MPENLRSLLFSESPCTFHSHVPDYTRNCIFLQVDSIVLHYIYHEVKQIKQLLGSSQTLQQLQQKITCSAQHNLNPVYNSCCHRCTTIVDTYDGIVIIKYTAENSVYY